jgi:hypothetical protein
MTGVHGQAVVLKVEPVRLFYVPVNLTIPSLTTELVEQWTVIASSFEIFLSRKALKKKVILDSGIEAGQLLSE